MKSREWERAGEWIRTHFDGRKGGWAVARLETLNPDMEANSRLILAAPKLLCAAEAVLAWLDILDIGQADAAALRAAVNEANGE